ncbi:MAG: fused MFS/spermidine synthase [Myxococcaceae bacterium]
MAANLLAPSGTMNSDRLRQSLLATFLFVSGATALVYELIWSKHLSNVLGNGGQSHAVVLATFMGGLALGAFVFGRMVDRARSPLRLYGYFELGIGLYALAFPSVLHGLGRVYLEVAPALPESARLFPKLLLAGIALLPPTMLMGGTLPAMVRHFATRQALIQRQLARLYAVNSLGGALGVFLAGVRLVPNFGLTAATVGAAALNVLLALGAIALSRAPSTAAPAPGDPDPAGGPVYARSAVRAALVGVALTGLTSMVYEIGWIRLLALVLGASTYVFTLILTAFILGIGLGSAFLMARKESADPLATFGRLQVALVVSVCVALPLYVRLPYWFWVAQHGLNREVEVWPVYQTITFAFCCGVLLVPAFLMGASFPSAARVATSTVQEIGRRLGGVYLWNTAGAIGGALLGGLWLLPAIGMEGCFAVAIVGNLAAGALALWNAPSRGGGVLRRGWPVGLGALAAGAYLLTSAGWAESVASAGTFRRSQPPPESFEAYREQAAKAVKVLSYQDDTFATVVVGQAQHDGHFFLQLNGKVDASTSKDSETQVMVGQFGALVSPRPVKTALLVGAGIGMTAGSMLTHPLERLDLVEISPAVIDAARRFSEHNRGALEDPRLRVHLDDAKTFMALSGTRYDLIVNEPSNPWVAGVAGLFTREFYQTASEHLAPGGVFVQWIHAYESDEQILKLVVRTLRETFPHCTTWIGPTDLVLVASREPLALSSETIAERMAIPAVAADLARVGVLDLPTLLAKQVHSDEGQAEFAGKGPINTDDENTLEYASPIAFFLSRDPAFVRDERRSPDGGRRLALFGYLAAHPLTAVQAERLYRNLTVIHRPPDPLIRAAAERWFALAPEDPGAAAALASAAIAQEDAATARAVLQPFLERGHREPSLVSAHLAARALEVSLTRAVWNPVEVDDALALGRDALAAAPADGTLRRSLAALCRASGKEDCAPAAEALAP